MRRFLVPGLFALTACSFHAGSLGDSDAAGDATAFDAAPDAAVDSDGDGLLDGDDNCPAAANADQHDEDADLRGDACDRCPHLASTTDPDADGDGVGDDCDPRPDIPGDSLLLFESFKDPGAFASWMGVGTWMVSNDQLHQTDATADLTYTYPPGTPTNVAITAGIHVDMLGVGSQSVNPGVLVEQGSLGTAQGYLCALSVPAAPRVDAFGFWSGGNNGGNAPWTGTLANGSDVRLTDAIVGTVHSCTVVQGTVTQSAPATHGATTGAVVVLTSRAAASFDYVFVVKVGS